jgi:uroporphyrin-III C-methyltransferase/precorrin-2 dehydrogenase/sirohydrochlorin ferrochelatase
LDQLPIFVNLKGRSVILVGEGEMADAKRRLIERAGGICVDADDKDARIAFVAIADEDAARVPADALKARGLLVNVVDRPEICDFTTPAIVDRTPVLVAVGTGGASAGMANALLGQKKGDRVMLAVPTKVDRQQLLLLLLLLLLLILVDNH